MKAVTAKMLISLVGLLLAAPFLAVALIVGARAVALSNGTGDDLLLVGLALAGVLASIVNGMGRRTLREGAAVRREAGAGSRARGASVIHLGY